MVWVLLSLLAGTSPARASDDLEFGADYYERNLEPNVIKGKGHAWIRSPDRKVWADEIEIDYSIKRALAHGNVRAKDLDTDIVCDRLSYSLDGMETILDNATIVSGQMVLSGATIQRLGKKHYDIEEGSYTNCGGGSSHDSAGSCVYDWKIYGRHFDIDVGAYAHISDALILVKEMPVLYSPYFVVPIKTDRQSGLLPLSLTGHGVKGSGVTLPFFWAIGRWHDLLITPTYFSQTGYHARLHYRYIYSRNAEGFVRYSSMERQFGRLPSETAGRSVIGEWSVFSKHRAQLTPSSFFNIESRMVSSALYAVDYGDDIETNADVASLRSQITYSRSTPKSFFGIGAIHYQSLLLSRDSGVDGGAVARLPVLQWSRTNSSILRRYLSFEIDGEFANFYRGGSGFDNVPDTIADQGDNVDSDPAFDGNDIIRTGRRFIMEPRVITSVPMPPGFQFQPVWNFGLLGYHFAIPTHSLVGRAYSSIELPLSLYLMKTYRSGDHAINHVLQPRVVYSKNLFFTDRPVHPFFRSYASSDRIRPTLFDFRDVLLPYEFARVELISRLRHRTGASGWSRFLLLQVAEQFNIKNHQNDTRLLEDPRYARTLGPIEGRAEISLAPWSAEVQASYNLEPTEFGGQAVNESDWSGGFNYQPGGQDLFGLSMRFINRADTAQIEQTFRFNFVKTTTSYLNFDGDIEYSLRRGSLVRYSLGTFFSRKPASCWNILFRVNQDRAESGGPFRYDIFFRFDFGTPGTIMRDA